MLAIKTTRVSEHLSAKEKEDGQLQSSRLQVGYSLGISVGVRNARWPSQDQRVQSIGVVEVAPQAAAILCLERIETQLRAVTVQADCLRCTQTRTKLRPALGQSPVMNLYKIHCTL